MKSATEVRNQLEAIISLAQEIQERMSGTSDEQHAVWLFLDGKALDTAENELLVMATNIAVELEEAI